jgi:hypothetical protein
MRVPADSLDGTNQFKLLADGFPGAWMEVVRVCDRRRTVGRHRRGTARRVFAGER